VEGTGHRLTHVAHARVAQQARRRRIVRGAIALGIAAIALIVTSFALARDRGLRTVPHPDADLERGACVVWCATAQRAWDGLDAAIGVGAAFRAAGPAGQRAVDGLGRRPFPQDAMDPAATALAAWRTPGGPTESDLARFRQLLGAQFEFPGGASGPGVAAIAAFSKRLPFAQRFDPLDERIRFAWAPMGVMTGVSVETFGSVGGGRCIEQVDLLAWEPHRDEFVLELRPADAAERILVAKLDPADTLEATWDAVRAWCARSARRPLLTVPGLRRVAIPTISLDARASFADLLGARSAKPPPGFELTTFEQWNRFRLDQDGAEIESIAFAGALELGGDPTAPSPVDFVVDRPFLVALKRADAEVPYFLLWVGGPAVLVRR
jgi:hypothetical protein